MMKIIELQKRKEQNIIKLKNKIFDNKNIKIKFDN